MPSGGPRARSGPPPDPTALRRERGTDSPWTHLPAAGRQGEPPTWPLSRQVAREKVLWAREWRRPQAVMWQANGQDIEVALYVRAVVAAEKPGASAPARSLVVRMQEALGLNLPGLMRNRWIIADGEAPVAGALQRGTPATSIKQRMKLVSGGS